MPHKASATLTWSNTALTADRTANAIDCSNLSRISVQFVWTGAAVGNFKLQQSNDGTNYKDIASATLAAGGASGNGFIAVEGVSAKYIRPAYAFTSGTGTIGDCVFVAKDI